MIKRYFICVILILAALLTSCNSGDGGATQPEETQPTEAKATDSSTSKPTEKPTSKPTEAPVPEETGEYYETEFKIGSIRGSTGVDFDNGARFVTDGYIAIGDIQAVTLKSGYCLSWFAYDGEYNYLGNGSNQYPTLPMAGVWLASGKGVTAAEIIAWNSEVKYVRFAVKKSGEGAVSLEEDVTMSDIKIYVSGYESEYMDAVCQKIGNISGSIQDGAVYGGYMFSFNSNGKCKVYSVDGFSPLSEFILDKNSILSPHSNAVCFGAYKYSESDEFPLLYCNIYNTYSSNRALDGTCNVYRITRNGNSFSSELVQIIKVGFTSDTAVWSSPDSNRRPYGNFVVDTDNNKLYAFTMRDESNTTRFFEFALPALSEGANDSDTGVKRVTLEASDVIRSFDVEYFRYVQGATYADGMIYSLEGFTNDVTNKAALKIVDLESGKLSGRVDLYGMGFTTEPEMVYVIDGILYYADVSGAVYKLTLK